MPMFIHDCDNCRYLGTLRTVGGPWADYYHCPNHGGELIIRLSGEEGDYSTAPYAMAEAFGGEFITAKKLADGVPL